MPYLDFLMQEVSDYRTLETAYWDVADCLECPPDELDAWLIELQNHLIWGSYLVAQDLDADAVVLEAIAHTAERLGLGAYDVTGEVRRILDELTLV